MANTTRPSVPPSHSSGVEHRRQIANVLNLLNQTTPDYSETTDERNAGVSIIDKSYPPGDPRRIKPVVNGEVKINIPSDVKTLQDAIDLFPLRVPGVTTVLNIESGHAPTSGIRVADGDYRHIVIRSADAKVDVSEDFTGDFLYGERAVLPVLDCLVDMNGRGSSGVYAIHRSSFRAEPGAGCINSGGYGCRLRRASVASINGTVWSGAALNGIVANEASIVDARNAVCDDCGERGFWSNNSFMAARDASAKRCGLRGVQCDPGAVFNGNVDVSGSFVGLCCQGGLASFGASNASNCTDMALLVFEGGHVRAHNLVATGSGSPLAACIVSQASSAFLRGSDFSGAAGDGLRVLSGSNVDARDVDCSNAGGFGVYVNDGGVVTFTGGTGTLSVPPNTLTGRGIINISGTNPTHTRNQDYTLSPSDVGQLLRQTTGDATYTVPDDDAIVEGSVIRILKVGSGKLTIVPSSGVTIAFDGTSTTITGDGGGSVEFTARSLVTLTKAFDTSWVLVGPSDTMTINPDAS